MGRFICRSLATGLGALAAAWVLMWVTQNILVLAGAAVLFPATALFAYLAFVRRDDDPETRARAGATLLGMVLATAVTWWVWMGLVSALGEN